MHQSLVGAVLLDLRVYKCESPPPLPSPLPAGDVVPCLRLQVHAHRPPAGRCRDHHGCPPHCAQVRGGVQEEAEENGGGVGRKPL